MTEPGPTGRLATLCLPLAPSLLRRSTEDDGKRSSLTMARIQGQAARTRVPLTAAARRLRDRSLLSSISAAYRASPTPATPRPLSSATEYPPVSGPGLDRPTEDVAVELSRLRYVRRTQVHPA